MMTNLTTAFRLEHKLGCAALFALALGQPAFAQEDARPWSWDGYYGADRDADFFEGRDWRDLEAGNTAVLSLRIGDKVIASDARRIPELGSKAFRVQVPAELRRLLPAMRLTMEIDGESWPVAEIGSLQIDSEQAARSGDALTLGAVLQVQPYLWGTQARGAVAPITPLFQASAATGSGIHNGGFQAPVGPTGPIVFNPPVTGFSPTAAGEGDTVSVSGDFSDLVANFGPEDVLVIAEGFRGYHGRANSLQASSLDFVLDDVPSYALDQGFKIEFGYGDTIVPMLSGISVPGIWVLGSPETFPVGESNQSLSVGSGSLYQTCQSITNACRRTPVSIDGGQLHFELPGFGVCDGDSILFWFRVKIDGIWYTIDVAPSSPFNQALSWGTVGEFVIANMLNQAFMFHQDGPLPLRASFDSASDQLIVEGWDSANGTPLTISDFDVEGWFGICWDQEQSVLVTERQGVADDYVLGNSELLTPWAPYRAWAQSTINGQTAAMTFDTNNVDKYMQETFDNYGSEYGQVRAAYLTVRMKATQALAYTDSINLGWNEQTNVFSWGVSLNAMPDIGAQWDVSDDIEVCFDLSRLIKSNGTITDIVDRLNDPSGRFHIFMQDDSAWDYVELNVWRCID